MIKRHLLEHVIPVVVKFGGSLFVIVHFRKIVCSLVMLGGLFAVTACVTSVFPAKTPIPEVIATAMVAEARGQLVEVDGCLRVRDPDANVDYAIV